VESARKFKGEMRIGRLHWLDRAHLIRTLPVDILQMLQADKSRIP